MSLNDHYNRKTDGARRHVASLSPEGLLKHAVVLRLKDKKGLWFMFHHSTSPADAGRIAVGLRAQEPPLALKDTSTGVVEMYVTEKGSNRKQRYPGLSLDPSDDRVKALLWQRHGDGRGPLVFPHMGGDALPELTMQEAADALFEYFSHHSRGATQLPR